jgi:pimeloyl-ACP methyl ester carboxylesterase
MTMIKALAFALALSSFGGLAAAQPAFDPVTADAPQDAAHPARTDAIQIPSGGVLMNGRAFIASGSGKHPTLLMLHGFPGNEQNFDLAQAVRRAGWNVVTFHYRGAWGSPGQFGFQHAVEDAHAALVWLRTPGVAGRLGVDTGRIVVMGHSMGGFLAATTTDDPQVKGFVFMSSWDIAAEAPGLSKPDTRAQAATNWAVELPPLAGTSFDALADEILAKAPAWGLQANAARIGARPTLILGSNDGGEPANDLLSAGVTGAGGKPTRVHIDTDHSYNDRRIALARTVVGWLTSAF